MNEPDLLNDPVACGDCDETGEQERVVAAGAFGHEGQDIITEECETCGGSTVVRLRNLSTTPPRFI